jgi:hypothetical protein
MILYKRAYSSRHIFYTDEEYGMNVLYSSNNQDKPEYHIFKIPEGELNHYLHSDETERTKIEKLVNSQEEFIFKQLRLVLEGTGFNHFSGKLYNTYTN